MLLWLLNRLSITMEGTKIQHFGIPFLIYCIASLRYLFTVIGVTVGEIKQLFFF